MPPLPLPALSVAVGSDRITEQVEPQVAGRGHRLDGRPSRRRRPVAARLWSDRMRLDPIRSDQTQRSPHAIIAASVCRLRPLDTHLSVRIHCRHLCDRSTQRAQQVVVLIVSADCSYVTRRRQVQLGSVNGSVALSRDRCDSGRNHIPISVAIGLI